MGGSGTRSHVRDEEATAEVVELVSVTLIALAGCHSRSRCLLFVGPYALASVVEKQAQGWRERAESILERTAA